MTCDKSAVCLLERGEERYIKATNNYGTRSCERSLFSHELTDRRKSSHCQRKIPEYFFFFFFFFCFCLFVCFVLFVLLLLSHHLCRPQRHCSRAARPGIPHLRPPHPGLIPHRGPAIQRSTGSDVRSLVGCHPKETLRCC